MSKNWQSLEEIIQTFGLTKPDNLLDLKVPAGQTIILSSIPQIKEAKTNVVEEVYHQLKPKGVDDLKLWGGIPDEKAPKIRSAILKTGFSKSVSRDLIGKSPIVEMKQNDLRTVMEQYVHGDSRTVSRYKSVLDQFVIANIPFIVIAILNTIDVAQGSTLEIMPNVNILSAWAITIHKGGKILAHSSLTIKSGSITGVD